MLDGFGVVKSRCRPTIVLIRIVTDVLQEERKMARFAQYAMAASEEALEDSGWKPTDFEQREATVCIVGAFPHHIPNAMSGSLPWIRHWQL